MSVKILLAVFVVAAGLAPGLAIAQACGHQKSAQISCAEGQTWDETTRSCVTVGS